MSTLYGMEWIPQGFFGDIVPKWTVDIDTEAMRKVVQRHLPEESSVLDITFHGQGSINKVFKVLTSHATYAMRISMPIEVPFKVQSEVSTMNFLERKTTIPVPKVYAYDASVENDIRFPWILMSFIDGRTVSASWPSLTPDHKSHVVRQLAEYTHELNQHHFKAIGSLFGGLSNQDALPDPGMSLSLIGAREYPLKATGPFRNSHQWFETRFTESMEKDQNFKLDPNDFENEEDVAAEEAAILEAAPRRAREQIILSDILSLAFDPESKDPAVLSLENLHGYNILIDESGTILSLIDWEFTTTKPVWSACKPPMFFDYGIDRYEPQTTFSDGEVNIYYDQEMMNWEMYDRYRKEFINNMAELDPQWLVMYRAAKLERDIEDVFDDWRLGSFGTNHDMEWMEKLKPGLAARGPLDVAKPVPIEDFKSRDYVDWLEPNLHELEL